MKKLALAAITVFAVMTILAVALVGDGERTIIDLFSRLDREGKMHYFFVVRLDGKRQTLEVPADVYAKHGYGDTLEAAWLQGVRY